MKKTFKYRIYPTKKQRTALQQSLDACRFVYNKTIEIRKTFWEERGETLSRYDTNKKLTQWKTEYPFLQNGHAQALQDAQKRVDLAFRSFFMRIKRGDTPGYPRFRGRNRYDSYTYPQERGNWKILDNARVRLSKIGNVKIKYHRPVEGTPKTLTISRDGLGNWWACFSCEVEPKYLPVKDIAIGVDLGLKTFATLSNGTVIKRERWMDRDAVDIARLNRKRDRLAKGSIERKKVLRALSHAYQRSNNRRKDFAHQHSKRMVDNYGLIVFEKLQIKDMLENGQSQYNRKALNRNILDVAWARFTGFTAYKAAYAGRGILFVNPKGTTQECSGCGAIVKKDLSVRIHNCPQCGLKIDRDLNAALNILGRGLASLDDSPESPLMGERSL